MDLLEHTINYSFSNKNLLDEALTHPSIRHRGSSKKSDNQRLEFLGDSVLQLTLTDLIYKDFPDYDEGKMTKLRAHLVSKEALHLFAKTINLQDFMIMGKGEIATGGQNRASTLADGLEAVIGAIYLDGGFDKAFQFIQSLVQDSLHKAAADPIEKNPKGQLQEILQAILPESPCYKVIDESGPDHNKVFMTQIIWNNKVLANGKGSSKKLSEIAAAELALKQESWKQ